MALLSQSEFARRQGWSRQYVAKLVKSGKITLQNGKIDSEAILNAIDTQSADTPISFDFTSSL